MESFNTPDNIIEQALALYDHGTPVATIIAQFPDHKDGLEDLFGFVSAIRHEGRQLPLPSREALQKTLALMPDMSEVSKLHQSLVPQVAGEGLLSSLSALVAAHWRIYGSLSAVAVAMLIFITNGFQNGEIAAPSTHLDAVIERTQSTRQASEAAPSALGAGGIMMMTAKTAGTAGSIDATVDTFIADAVQEQTLFDTEASAILASVDGAAISSLDTTISSYEY